MSRSVRHTGVTDVNKLDLWFSSVDQKIGKCALVPNGVPVQRNHNGFETPPSNIGLFVASVRDSGNSRTVMFRRYLHS